MLQEPHQDRHLLILIKLELSLKKEMVEIQTTNVENNKQGRRLRGSVRKKLVDKLRQKEELDKDRQRKLQQEKPERKL